MSRCLFSSHTDCARRKVVACRGRRESWWCGKIARLYQKAVGEVVNGNVEKRDLIGLEGTKINAALLFTIFEGKAYPRIIHDNLSKKDLLQAKISGENLYIASGGKPGRSTDYGATKLAEVFGTKDVIIAGNVPYVFDRDPKNNPQAKAFPEISWKEYEKLIPKKWTPGFSSPVDPIATQLAKKLKLQVKVIKGTDFVNFKNAIDGKKFKGTLIS